MLYTHITAFNDHLADRLGEEKLREVIRILATFTPEQVEAVEIYGDSRYENGCEDVSCNYNP